MFFPFDMSIINAKFNAEFESVEKSAKKCTQNSYWLKTIVHSNKVKNSIFSHFFVDNFFGMSFY